MVPALKVIKKMPAKSLSHSAIDLSPPDESTNSTYKVDFKKHDFDICMSKAYEIIANKMTKLPMNNRVEEALQTPNQQTLVK